ncbi:MAG: TonB-dependent receptor [Alphaproteobacteria bacterium]|nr:TonB-dependent receptor [Alphaproteobacteria bacterium]
MLSGKRIRGCVALGLLGVVAAPPSYAAVDEIIVTAQRREQRLEDVPVAVTSISGDMLSKSLISNVEDIGKLAPSVSFREGQDTRGSSINIRGVGTAVYSAAVEPSVSVVVDGVVLQRQEQGFGDLIDIDRIEVLRGPQSTLFGKGASAGVINIVSKRPSKEMEAVFEATVAELNEYNGRATVSGPLGANAGFRVTASVTDRDGYIHNFYDGRDVNGAFYYGARALFDVKPNDWLKLTFIGDYARRENECCQWVGKKYTSPLLISLIAPATAGKESRTTNSNARIFNDSEQFGGSVEANADLGSSTLTSITAYRRWNLESNSDIDETPTSDLNPVVGETNFNLNEGETDFYQLTQELRLNSNGSGPIEYVVGGFMSYLFQERIFERRTVSCTGAPVGASCPGIGLTYTPRSGFFRTEVETVHYSGFGQLDWHATDKLTLFGGGRLQYEEMKVHSTRPGLPLPAYPGDTVIPNLGPLDAYFNLHDVGWSARAGAQYAFSDTMKGYISYGRGYKGPATDVTLNATPADVKRAVDPETSNAYEIGLKARFFDRRLSVDLAAFWVDYDDFQAQAFSTADNRFIVQNAGSVRTRGIEADIQAKPTDEWLIFGGFTFANARIVNFPAGQCYLADPDCVGTNRKPLDGGQLPNAPEWKVSVGSRYERPLFNLGVNGFVQANYSWQDDIVFDLNQNPDTSQKAYGLLDLSFGVGDPSGAYRVTFFVKNALNEHYATWLLQDFLQTTTVNINQLVPKDADRFVGATVQLRF